MNSSPTLPDPADSPALASLTGHSPWLRYVAAFGLPGSMLEPPRSPLADRAFGRLYAAASEQRLTGLLWAATTSGVFPTTPSQRDAIRESHRRALAGVLLLERLLVETVDSLSGAGIPARVLKGAAMAHLDYPNPAQRTFGDIDLLVPGESFDEAVRVLTRAGCRRQFPEPRPGFDGRFGKGACLRTPSGQEIDLHRTFSMGPFGERLALDRVWRESDSFVVAGRSLQALSAEGRLLHATYHAVLGDQRPRLVPLRDIAQLALGGAVDWPRLWELMEASSGEPVAARAVTMSWAELRIGDVLAITEWAAHYREQQRASADISAYTSTPSYAARAFATLGAIPTVRDKLRFLTALLLPESGYVAGRHPSRGGRLRRGVVEIRQSRGAS